MKNKYSTNGIPILIIGLLAIPLAALAQIDLEGAITGAGLGQGSPPTVAQILVRIITVSLSFIGLIAIGAIIYGGFTYVVSLGDDAKVARAKKIILYSVLGLLVAFVAGSLVSFVFNNF